MAPRSETDFREVGVASPPTPSAREPGTAPAWPSIRPDHAAVLAMQRGAGNSAVVAMLRAHASPTRVGAGGARLPPVQGRLMRSGGSAVLPQTRPYDGPTSVPGEGGIPPGVLEGLPDGSALLDKVPANAPGGGADAGVPPPPDGATGNGGAPPDAGAPPPPAADTDAGAPPPPGSPHDAAAKREPDNGVPLQAGAGPDAGAGSASGGPSAPGPQSDGGNSAGPPAAPTPRVTTGPPGTSAPGGPPGPSTTGGPDAAPSRVPSPQPPRPDKQIGGQSEVPPDACLSPDAPGSADLISFELAEHETWSKAAVEVGGAGTERRADFIADSVGGGMNTGLVTGANAGVVMGFGSAAAGRIAARRLPVPIVGAIIGGVIGAVGLYNTIVNEPDKFLGAVGKIGEGASGYEKAANTIEGIMAILDLAANIIDVVALITGVIAAAAWLGVIPSFGASSPIAVNCTLIATKAAIISAVLSVVKAALGPMALLFRALHTFTTQADPREVQAQGTGLSDSAKAVGGYFGALAGAAVGSRAGEAAGNRIADRMGPVDPPRVPAGNRPEPPTVEGKPSPILDANGNPIMTPGPSPIIDPSTGRPFRAEPATGPSGLLDATGRPIEPGAPSPILDATGTPYGPTNRPAAPAVTEPSPIIDPGTRRPAGSPPPAIVNPSTGLPVGSLPPPSQTPLIVGSGSGSTGAPARGPLIVDPSTRRPALEAPSTAPTPSLLDSSGRPLGPPSATSDGPSPIIDPGTDRPVGTGQPSRPPVSILDSSGNPVARPAPPLAPQRVEPAPSPSSPGTPSPILDANGNPIMKPGPSPIIDPSTGRPFRAGTGEASPGTPSPILDANGNPIMKPGPSPIIDPSTGRPFRAGTGEASPGTPSPILDANGNPIMKPGPSPIIDPSTGRAFGTPAPAGGRILDANGNPIAPPVASPIVDEFGRPFGPDNPPRAPRPEPGPTLPYDPNDPSSVRDMPPWLGELDNAGDAQQTGELATGAYERNFGQPEPTPASPFTYDNRPFADVSGGWAGLGQTSGEAADARVERVNPAYTNPPGTLADLAALADQETRLRALATEARGDAATEDSSREVLECREQDLDKAARFNAELKAARAAHDRRIAEAKTANEGKQQHEQQVGQRAGDAQHQLSGARTLKPLLGGWVLAASAAGAVMGLFSSSAEAKCDESAQEASNFIAKLDEVVAQVEREQAAAPARAEQAKVEGEVVQASAQQGQQTDAEAARTAEQTKAVQAANANDKAVAGSSYERALADAERADRQADQIKADHDALQAELATWAQLHREARATSVNETVAKMEAAGYVVTRRPDG